MSVIKKLIKNYYLIKIIIFLSYNISYIERSKSGFRMLQFKVNCRQSKQNSQLTYEKLNSRIKRNPRITASFTDTLLTNTNDSNLATLVSFTHAVQA